MRKNVKKLVGGDLMKCKKCGLEMELNTSSETKKVTSFMTGKTKKKIIRYKNYSCGCGFTFKEQEYQIEN